MSEVRITWDRKAKAVYIYLSNEEAQHHVDELQEGIWIDRGIDGGVIGIELLNVEERPSLEEV